MDQPHETAGTSNLADLGAAAQEFLRENPPGGVEVPAHPAVRLAAGACDLVLGMFLCCFVSCPLTLLLSALFPSTHKQALIDVVMPMIFSLAAAAYTIPEAFGSRTLAKAVFKLRLTVAVESGDARRGLRRRWLLKASPWLLLAACWATAAVHVAVFGPPDPFPIDDPEAWPFLVAAGVTLLLFVPCFAATRQSVYDRFGRALVIRKVPLHQQRGHGFEVVPMARVAEGPLPGTMRVPPAGLAPPREDGYLPAADDE